MIKYVLYINLIQYCTKEIKLIAINENLNSLCLAETSRVSIEKGERGDVIVWKESSLPIKHGTHSYEMPTARLSGQARYDPLITPYMVMGLVS